MSPQQGMFFAIEGIDSTSRDTQFKYIVNRLTKAGHKVVSFEFSQNDRPSAYFIKQYIRGSYGAPDQIGPYTASLFYALDHYEAAAKIRLALDEGAIVVTNHFIGANMGHQGAKFNHGEQRLGYFIWLDNMEFELLGIPRPDLNFVLRMPADTIKDLAGTSPGNPYTQMSAAGATQSFERAVEVYDDLCQLFPKDFSRIDCVRGGTLLEQDTIATLIWEKLHPLLPLLPVKAKDLDTDTVSPSVDNDSNTMIAFEASSLLAEKISSKVSVPSEASETEYSYYVPDGLAEALRDSYVTTMESLRTLHGTLIERTTDYLVQLNVAHKDITVAHHTAVREMRSVIPVASLTSISILPVDTPEVLESLSASKLSEAHNLCKLLDATSVSNMRVSEDLTTTKWVEQQLSGNHAESSMSKLELTDTWPRNELSILGDVLYAGSDRSLSELQDEISTWPYEQKTKLFSDYFASQPVEQLLQDSLLHNFHYSWDVVSSFQTFSDLPRAGSSSQSQPLSPRRGYDTPSLIEEAGLSDMYDDCFDMSIQLYSALQAAGHTLDAQYATLRGHELRYKVTYTASDILRLHLKNESATSMELRGIIQKMLLKITEVHPLLAMAVTAIAERRTHVKVDK